MGKRNLSSANWRSKQSSGAGRPIQVTRMQSNKISPLTDTHHQVTTDKFDSKSVNAKRQRDPPDFYRNRDQAPHQRKNRIRSK